MIIWSSINYPTVICLPTVCYFSREKPLVKPTAPGSSFSYICFAIYFICTFYSDLLNQKHKKNVAALFLFAIYYSIYYNLFPVHAPFEAPYPKGIDNPFNTSGCEVLLFVCRGCLHCVAWFSYWFDNLGFITEGNTYRWCATSSSPPRGNTDVVLAKIIKGIIWRRCWGGSST